MVRPQLRIPDGVDVVAERRRAEGDDQGRLVIVGRVIVRRVVVRRVIVRRVVVRRVVVGRVVVGRVVVGRVVVRRVVVGRVVVRRVIVRRASMSRRRRKSVVERGTGTALDHPLWSVADCRSVVVGEDDGPGRPRSLDIGRQNAVRASREPIIRHRHGMCGTARPVAARG